MNKKIKSIVASAATMTMMYLMNICVFAAEEVSVTGAKATASAITIGLAAAAGAIGMAIGIAKAVEGVSRQPEAAGKIQTILMLGLVFVETAIIYALIVAILIIFVL